MNKALLRFCTLAAFATPVLFLNNLMAQAPLASTVPAVASNLSSSHNSWSGNQVTLKGALITSNPTDTFTYDWDPGDGTAHCTGTVTNVYVIPCVHTYTGTVGQSFTAVLKVTDTTLNLVSPLASNCPVNNPSITNGACYYTQLFNPPPNLPVEVNNAIDNGLWYLHTQLVRYTTAGGTPAGTWYGSGGNVDTSGSGDYGPDSQECAAFENSGFLAANSLVPASPYTSDVQLCLNGVLDHLTTIAISSINNSNFGNYNPDSNGNGIAVEKDSGYVNYQTGMMADALVASANPTATVPAGTELGTAITAANVKGSGTGGAYTYKDAVIDMVDAYAYCQAQDTGGWHYYCQESNGDNSVSQWAAIGIIPAVRTPGFGATVPAELHTADESWLDESFTQAGTLNGYFGYTSNSPLWGPYADTPSGLVQLAMNGLGRGTTSPGGNKLWDSAETFIRDNFGTPEAEGGYYAIKGYYYGLFSFTKGMLLHDNNDGGSAQGSQNQPLTTLVSSDDPGTCASPGVPVTAPGSGTGPCYPALDWYGAQTSAYGGTAPTNGVARTIVNDQLPNGAWFGQNYNGAQNYFQTGISITMLDHTVTKAVPVACFTDDPSQVASGAPATLLGGCSVDQNPANHLVTWQWDLYGQGGSNFTLPAGAKCLTASCSSISYNFTLPAHATLPYNYPVRLRVTDNVGNTNDVVGTVVISAPPNPPQANPGGPYNFCPIAAFEPFLLDGSHSTNPDQGKSLQGCANCPPSTIISYLWDFSGGSNFTSASGAQVNATAAFAAHPGTSFPVSLQVTNNDNLAFNDPNALVSSVGRAQVTIHNTTDEACTHCPTNLTSLVKAPTPGVAGNVQLYWTDTNTSPQFPIDHYNVYRSTTASFIPNTQIAGASSNPFIPAVKVSVPAGGKLYFQDNAVTGGVTYYYRVAPATASDEETCSGSNETIVVTVPKGRT
jgi:hypothetical protein